MSKKNNKPWIFKACSYPPEADQNKKWRGNHLPTNRFRIFNNKVQAGTDKKVRALFSRCPMSHPRILLSSNPTSSPSISTDAPTSVPSPSTAPIASAEGVSSFRRMCGRTLLLSESTASVGRRVRRWLALPGDEVSTHCLQIFRGQGMESRPMRVISLVAETLMETESLDFREERAGMEAIENFWNRLSSGRRGRLTEIFLQGLDSPSARIRFRGLRLLSRLFSTIPATWRGRVRQKIAEIRDSDASLELRRLAAGVLESLRSS